MEIGFLVSSHLHGQMSSFETSALNFNSMSLSLLSNDKGIIWELGWRESVTFDASGVEITMNPFFLGWKWRPIGPFYSVESKSFHSRQNRRSGENFPPNETRKLLLLLYFFVHTFSDRSSRLLLNTFSPSTGFIVSAAASPSCCCPFSC